MNNTNKRLRPNTNTQLDSCDSGILNERILRLVFESIKWDLQTLCSAASVNHKLRAIAKRLLWKELCVYRAPRMLTTLSINHIPNTRFNDYWHSLAKLMFYCCGCASSTHFKITETTPGHLVKESRFSKTSGKSFLVRKCRGDLLYVSDPCEHQVGGNEDDLGVYRGLFKGFTRSKTRACLVERQVELEETVRCPYCGARVWSMTTARLVPKSAARRLGCRDGGLEYFVCVYGHLHGTCWLTPLSSDEDVCSDGDDYSDDEDGEKAASNGCSSTSSTGDEIVAVDPMI